MWCPEGFVNLLTIEGQIRAIVKCKRLEQQHARDGAGWLPLAEEEAIIFKNCLHEFFSNCPSFALFSTTGVTLFFDKRIMAHRFISQLGWQYSFIDSHSGTLSAAQLEKCSTAAKEELAELRSQLDEIDLDRRYVHYCELAKIEDDVELWEVIKVFDGWAVGCSEIDLPTETDDFLSLDVWSVDEVDDDIALIRPRDLKAEIIKAHDEGAVRSKHSLWKEHFPTESREAFRAAWAEAAKERPELSKRGPKSM